MASDDCYFGYPELDENAYLTAGQYLTSGSQVGIGSPPLVSDTLMLEENDAVTAPAINRAKTATRTSFFMGVSLECL
jgi:hypothetical protein